MLIPMKKISNIIMLIAIMSIIIITYQVINTSIIFHQNLWVELKNSSNGIFFWLAIIIISYLKNILALTIVVYINFFIFITHIKYNKP